MKETRFIAQNKEKWQESEKLLRDSEKDPEKLSNLFTQVVDDLSFSRTYYPNRSVRVYLNRIAREYFSIIYSHHQPRKNTFKTFWVDELPQIVYESRRPLLISLTVFVLALVIGVFSSVKDPRFTSTILGETYVEMTKSNIEGGDPMAVYKDAHQMQMFLGITFNNLMVAFRTYVFGIFFSIGTIAILLYNGIMVGCFQFFFIERGLLAESALTIWLHGTLEISSIIISGGAGLTLGSGLLFPGTYSRLQAFQMTAMRSLKLMLGIAPVLIFAAIIESFLTRYTEAPDFVRLLLILMSAFFIVGYFVVYPWMKFRRGFERPLEEVKLPPNMDSPVSFTRIKNNGEIIKDSFLFYKKYSRKLFAWIFLVTILAAGAEVSTPEERVPYQLFFESVFDFLGGIYYAMKTPSVEYMVINTASVALILYKVLALVDRESKPEMTARFSAMALLQTILFTAFGYSLLLLLGGWGTFLMVIGSSLLILLTFTGFAERRSFPGAISRGLGLCAVNFGQVLGLHLILLMLTFSFLLILSAPVLYVNTSILQWNFAESDVWSKGLVRFVDVFLKLFAFNLVIPVFGSAIAYLYFTLREIGTAENLKRSIAAIGMRKSKDIRA